MPDTWAQSQVVAPEGVPKTKGPLLAVIAAIAGVVLLGAGWFVVRLLGSHDAPSVASSVSSNTAVNVAVPTIVSATSPVVTSPSEPAPSVVPVLSASSQPQNNPPAAASAVPAATPQHRPVAAPQRPVAPSKPAKKPGAGTGRGQSGPVDFGY
ncbi:MAG TPA: hypothetical protein VIV60_26235, partial [Polyangiaceae bacterium]